MSVAAAHYTIVGALAAIEERLGAPPEWKPGTSAQAAFLRDIYAVCRPEVGRIAEIKSFSALSSAEPAAGSFPSLGPNEVAAVSVLDLLVSWVSPGTGTTLTTRDERRFPAVRLPASQVRFLSVASHPAPIAMIRSVSGDSAYLTPMAQPDYDLVALAQRLTNEAVPHGGRLGGLVFPKVDLASEQRLEVAIGLTTRAADGRPVVIRYAEQLQSLKMNEVGARVEAQTKLRAAVVGVSSRGPDFVINEPFLVWFRRFGLSSSLFVAYVTHEDWRDPGNLSPRLSRSPGAGQSANDRAAETVMGGGSDP
jgi:hypothetical protein